MGLYIQGRDVQTKARKVESHVSASHVVSASLKIDVLKNDTKLRYFCNQIHISNIKKKLA
jgi:nitrate reductase cytochrome c-type subunit